MKNIKILNPPNLATALILTPTTVVGVIQGKNFYRDQNPNSQ
jgi:hypothetical protein